MRYIFLVFIIALPYSHPSLSDDKTSRSLDALNAKYHESNSSPNFSCMMSQVLDVADAFPTNEIPFSSSLYLWDVVKLLTDSSDNSDVFELRKDIPRTLAKHITKQSDRDAVSQSIAGVMYKKGEIKAGLAVTADLSIDYLPFLLEQLLEYNQLINFKDNLVPVLNRFRKYVDELDDAKQKVKALVLIARLKFSLDNNRDAQQLLDEALAHTRLDTKLHNFTHFENDYNLKMMREIANTFIDFRKFDEALKIKHMILEFYKKAKDYDIEKSAKFAASILVKAAVVKAKEGASSIDAILINEAVGLIKASAKRYSDKFKLKNYGEFSSSHNAVLAEIALYYSRIGNLEKALKFIEKIQKDKGLKGNALGLIAHQLSHDGKFDDAVNLIRAISPVGYKARYLVDVALTQVNTNNKDKIINLLSTEFVDIQTVGHVDEGDWGTLGLNSAYSNFSKAFAYLGLVSEAEVLTYSVNGRFYNPDSVRGRIVKALSQTKQFEAAIENAKKINDRKKYLSALTEIAEGLLKENEDREYLPTSNYRIGMH